MPYRTLLATALRAMAVAAIATVYPPATASAQEGDLTSEALLQNDFMLTVGVAMPIGGRE